MHRPRSTFWSFGTVSYLLDTVLPETAGGMPGAWLIKGEQFEAFIEKVRLATGRIITKADIDFVVGYTDRSTREDLEAGEGNPKSHARYTRALEMEPSDFLAKLSQRNS